MLSLTEKTKIRVVIKGGLTELVEVQNIDHVATAYDTYGNEFPFRVEKAAEPEARVYIMAQNGEALVFGEKHTILCHEMGSPVWKRVPIMDVTVKHLARLPQKKVYIDSACFDALEMDKDGLFLEAETVKDLITLAEHASTCGITVARHKTKKRIDISVNRPVCFASKLINGNFLADFEGALAELAANGVVMPWRLWSPEMLEQIKGTGVIFEGAGLYNNVPMMPPRMLPQPIPVWHVYPLSKEDELKPVELVWFMT